MVAVNCFESAVFVGDRNFLVLEHAPIQIAEHREEDLVGKVGLRRLPVDIEE